MEMLTRKLNAKQNEIGHEKWKNIRDFVWVNVLELISEERTRQKKEIGAVGVVEFVQAIVIYISIGEDDSVFFCSH